MFKLCLFDLDDTLLRTADLKEIREAGKNDDSEEYKSRLLKAYRAGDNRVIYDDDLLQSVQNKFPNTKFGVFTRAPRSYARILLNEAYSFVRWDVVIGYEDVKRTKPSGEGIHLAMDKCGLKQLDTVLMVGDGDADVRAAYNAGVAIALDKTSWSRNYSYDNWDALNHIPDMILEDPSDVISALEALPKFQPDLEWALSGFAPSPDHSRFEKAARWLHKEVGGGKKPYQIFTCGRSFAGYESVSERKKWHALTNSIHKNKEADVFPDEWIASIYRFMRSKIGNLSIGHPLVISVVPHRPGRKPRLENLLGQLEKHVKKNPFPGSNRIQYCPTLLAYKEGVKSNSNEKLNALDRFKNIRDHLHVNQNKAVSDGNPILMIDDVCTTGSSLIYASIRLEEAGAGSVTRLAISMNIGNVL